MNRNKYFNLVWLFLLGGYSLEDSYARATDFMEGQSLQPGALQHPRSEHVAKKKKPLLRPNESSPRPKKIVGIPRHVNVEQPSAAAKAKFEEATRIARDKFTAGE